MNGKIIKLGDKSGAYKILISISAILLIIIYFVYVSNFYKNISSKMG